MTMRASALLIGSALGFMAIVSTAGAQDYGPPPGPGYYGPPPEEVIVRPPHNYAPERSAIGAPIENVAISREVRIGDLDLRTHWGARELRNRISYTATTLCNRLNAMYPITADGSGDCYRDAMRDAMAQAHQAISVARGGDGYDDEY